MSIISLLFFMLPDNFEPQNIEHEIVHRSLVKWLIR